MSDAEDDTPMLICAPVTTPLYLPDNLVDMCSLCGDPVQLRPNAVCPRRIVCMHCARIEDHDRIVVTKTSLIEFFDWLNKRGTH